MKLYNCKVRLGGLILNEVRKDGVTPAEIEVLRAIHGSDAVVDIVPGTPKNTSRKSAEERTRLYEQYASHHTMTAEAQKKRMAMLRDLFGHDRNVLPEDLADVPAEGEAEPAFAA